MQPNYLYVSFNLGVQTFPATLIEQQFELKTVLDSQRTQTITSKPLLLTWAIKDNLTLSDRAPATNGMRRPPARLNTSDKLPPPSSAVTSARGENVPPRGPPGHRPTRSQEDAMRARRAAASESRPRPNKELDIFADPPDSPKKSDARHMRRNSESSIMERNSKPIDPEEEKKRQERKRREQRHREREGGHSSSRSKKPDRKLDIIDKLDVTSIYGTGCRCY